MNDRISLRLRNCASIVHSASTDGTYRMYRYHGGGRKTSYVQVVISSARDDWSCMRHEVVSYRTRYLIRSFLLCHVLYGTVEFFFLQIQRWRISTYVQKENQYEVVNVLHQEWSWGCSLSFMESSFCKWYVEGVQVVMYQSSNCFPRNARSQKQILNRTVF